MIVLKTIRRLSPYYALSFMFPIDYLKLMRQSL